MKLGIGTAQFGMEYGAFNEYGQTAIEEVSSIVAEAEKTGIKVIDTAPAYGNSEEVLGKCLRSRNHFRIVTKTPVFTANPITRMHAEHLQTALANSLKKMGLTSVYGLLIHHADNLLAVNGHLLYERMNHLKQRGMVNKIGVSVYTGEQIDKILESYAIDIIQLPLNVLDQRLLRSGHLKKLRQRGVEIHARSAFLQGLLLISPKQLPAYFQPVAKHIQKYHQFLHDNNLSPLQGALGFVIGVEEIEHVICGVNNMHQFQELLTCLPRNDIDFSPFSLDDPKFIDPVKWNV